MEQLELFNQPRDVIKEMNDFKKEWERTRKSLYAHLADTKKKQQELSHEYEIMKLNICKGKLIP